MTRQAIADALSTVESITGTPTAPRILGRGQGWPVWVSRTPLTFTKYTLTWRVHITLPAGLEEASVLEADELTEEILAALEAIGEVTQIEPDSLASIQDPASQPVPALTVTMTTIT